ncbi:MAG: hypothetical protein FJ012_09680 [Chloroflexi bacterium]|nr:hypothetical protein [Chloroflexota bacterium]
MTPMDAVTLSRSPDPSRSEREGVAKGLMLRSTREATFQTVILPKIGAQARGTNGKTNSFHCQRTAIFLLRGAHVNGHDGFPRKRESRNPVTAVCLVIFITLWRWCEPAWVMLRFAQNDTEALINDLHPSVTFLKDLTRRWLARVLRCPIDKWVRGDL